MTPPPDGRGRLARLAGALRAERLKLRRSFAATLVVLAPAVAALLALALKNMVPGDAHADPALVARLYLSLCLSTWGLLFVQVHAVLRSAATGQVEFANRGLKHLFALPVSRRAIYAAKALDVAGSALAACLLFFALAVAIGFAQGTLSRQLPAQVWTAAALQAALLMLATLALCSVQVALSVNLASFVAVTCVGFAATLFGFFGQVAFGGYILYFPWHMPSAIVNAPPDARLAACAWALALIAASSVIGARCFERRVEL